MKRLFALSVLLVFGSVAYADYEMSDSEKERYLKWGAQFQDQGLYSFDRPVALAVSPNGCYGMAVLCNGCFQISWQSTLKILKRDALRSCKWKCKSSACKIMDVNGTSAFINSQRVASRPSTASSSKWIWCATASSIIFEFASECRNKGGKPHATYSLAQAEHQRLKEAATPVVKTATLTLRSNVKDDRVYIDGDFKGSTRLALDLPKGQHTIRIEKEGYEPYEKTITLTAALNVKGHLEKVAAQPAQTTTVQPSTVDNTAEIEFWKSIKNSDDRDMYREYLRQFPSGVYAGLAELKIKKLGSDSAVATTPNLDYGNYHALVIGNNRYRNFTDLNTPINDARTVASVLESKYGFKVNTLENATESKIFKAIVDLRSTVGRNDNVLIYYGGHGDLDNVTDEGFWIPSDAREDDPSTYLAVDRIRKQIKAMPAKHVMVVADSCFAGSLTRTTLTRALKVKPRSPEYHSELQRISNKKSRTALTSGGLEPVLDSGSDGHSVFAGAFISALENNDGVLDAHMLFIQVRDNVRNNSSQNPEYSPIYETGHDGGDFLFVRR